MTVRGYMLRDIAVLMLLFCLLETLSVWAFGFFPGEVYVLSLVPFLSLLMLMRWGPVGLIPAVLAGALYALLHEGTPVNYAVYALGGGFAGLNLLWFRFVGAQKVRGSAAYTALYCVTGYCALCLGRAVVSGVLGREFFPALVRFFSVESLGAVFTVILMLIARRQNGVFEPQIDYLIRLSKEEEERKHGV